MSGPGPVHWCVVDTAACYGPSTLAMRRVRMVLTRDPDDVTCKPCRLILGHPQENPDHPHHRRHLKLEK